MIPPGYTFSPRRSRILDQLCFAVPPLKWPSHRERRMAAQRSPARFAAARKISNENKGPIA